MITLHITSSLDLKSFAVFFCLFVLFSEYLFQKKGNYFYMKGALASMRKKKL